MAAYPRKRSYSAPLRRVNQVGQDLVRWDTAYWRGVPPKSLRYLGCVAWPETLPGECGVAAWRLG
jgi:hypothetical protein